MIKIRDDLFAMRWKKPSKSKLKELNHEQDLVYCQHCNHLIQYKAKDIYKERSCPKCRKFFAPINCNRRKRIDFTQWDSPTEWEEV